MEKRRICETFITMTVQTDDVQLHLHRVVTVVRQIEKSASRLIQPNNRIRIAVVGSYLIY